MLCLLQKQTGAFIKRIIQGVRCYSSPLFPKLTSATILISDALFVTKTDGSLYQKDHIRSEVQAKASFHSQTDKLIAKASFAPLSFSS